MIKILFIGSTNLSRAVLEKLIELKLCDVKGVLSNSKKFQISYSQSLVTNFNFADLSEIAESNSISFYNLNSGMNEEKLQDWIESLEIEIILVIGWYHMIPKNLLEKYLCVAAHASLLPNYRGGAPLVWAVISGEKLTGVTLFKMNEGVDSGPIILQEKFSISESDTIRDLQVKAESSTLTLVEQFFRSFPKIELKPQSNLEQSLVYKQRNPLDGRINFFDNAGHLYNFIRAQTKPYPGAFLQVEAIFLMIWSSQVIDLKMNLTNVGKLVQDSKSLFLICAQGTLKLNDFEIKNSGAKLHIDDFVSLWNKS